MATLRLLLILTIVFSLASLPGVLSSNFHLPSIPVVRAQQENTYGSWYPAGAQERTLSISQGDGVTGTQVGWLLTNQVDAEDWPLTASQQGGGSGNVNCSGSSSIICSAPVPDRGYFEIELNLAGVFWGIPMDYGNSPAGIELRQGIAHLFNKQSFAANDAGCLSVACIPDDQAIPVCTISVGCANGGLYAANPCGWDTKYAQTSSTNCVVGAPGGTAYNCSFSSACPTGTLIGSTTFPWQAAIGSPDFCAAAQHFIQAFSDAGINGVTTNTNCELVAPTGGWPASVTALPPPCDGFISPTASVCFIVRTTEPRKSLGEGLAQDICALFSPAWSAWTTLAGQPFSCDNSNTGTGNAACGGGSCPFLQEIEGVEQICVLTTSTNGVPNNCWGMYTAGFGQVFPFDSTTYFYYNSLFATKTTVTCTSANCSSNVPGSPCASTIFTSSAADYMYVCSPIYDGLSQAMEFSPCLSATGDPTPNADLPTFVNCSGGIVGPGTGSTSCIGASESCTAISAGYQAEDYFGSHAFTIPVWSGRDVQGRLSNWAMGGSSPGFITAFGGGYSASANYFNWLNAYSATPAISGTFRQSFLTTGFSLSPFATSSYPWDGYIMSNIYDNLFVQNPLCSQTPPTGSGVNQCSSILQNIDWMTTSHSFLCYPGGPACTATNLGYGNSTYFAGTTADLRLTLNRSNHWHDGGPVTAWDVKYSFIDLNATGSFQATSLASIAHINVLDEFTVDLNLKAKGPFTELFLGGITIMPGHVWSGCGASTWNSGVLGKNLVGTSIVAAAEDNCVGAFGSPNVAVVNGVPADSPAFDPIANNFLIGSGPYTCQSIGGTGHPAVGTLGGGCSIDNTQAPAFGLGDFTLTRTGCTLTGTGTTCGIAGSSSDYFRSSGALAKYIWSGDIGSGGDFNRLLTVNSCHSTNPSANCPHWAQGIGNPGGTGTNPVGLSQRAIVNSLRSISWIGFSTEKTAGSLLILTCSAGYTMPGTTITQCKAPALGTNFGVDSLIKFVDNPPAPVPNAAGTWAPGDTVIYDADTSGTYTAGDIIMGELGWTTTVLPGIGAYATTLYEVGSTVLSTSTSTLTPASPGFPNCAPPVGTGSAYPNGGYDC